MVALARFNLLHGYWHHSDVTDVIDILKAVTLGSLCFFLTVRYALGVLAFPLTLYALEAITTTAALSGLRLLALALRTTTRVLQTASSVVWFWSARARRQAC